MMDISREYAEYRVVFGPMRLGEVKIKLGKDTFITASRNGLNSNNIDISISRREEKIDKTDMLDELATKHNKGLIDADLSEWLIFISNSTLSLDLNCLKKKLLT
jgi:hypothetical protein